MEIRFVTKHLPGTDCFEFPVTYILNRIIFNHYQSNYKRNQKVNHISAVLSKAGHWLSFVHHPELKIQYAMLP